MILGAANAARSLGYETILDEKPETFPASFPLSQIAFYAGWYDWNVSGPFLQPNVEFMPGAFAYHLHSFSAQILRSTTEHWVGPLLEKGATATLGCVDEPYLAATPDIAAFFSRFAHHKFTFGEAAWACQNSVSWQNIAVGDPLYRPFARSPKEMHLDLERRLRDRSAAQVPMLDVRARDPLGQVVEQLGRVIHLRERRVTEDASAVQGKRGCGADWTAQSV